MICNKDHRYDILFADLPESQAGAGRHLCAACAYEAGYADALAKIPPFFNARSIPLSQAGVVRHKDANAAYCLGYLAGINN